MIVLGIETSCDETAVGIVELTDPTIGAVLIANSVASSLETHVAYGGVVPELAARAHYESMTEVINDAISHLKSAYDLKTDQEAWDKIDAIAVTQGAGLGGCLQIGVMAAKTLAMTHNKPVYACNHVEGHVYANFITEMRGHGVEGRENIPIEATPYPLPSMRPYNLPSNTPSFPMLALIVSGGHTQLVYFKNHFDYFLIGKTYDDAIGEAFDKVAKMLGLPYPGGPSISKAAVSGDENYFRLPISKVGTSSPGLIALRSELERSTKSKEQSLEDDSDGQPYPLEPTPSTLSYDFSFSGLKTAVLRALQVEVGVGINFPSQSLPERLSEPQKCSMSASFQRVAVETVVQKTLAAYREFGASSIVIAGGVAANMKLREKLSEVIDIPCLYTDIRLCTDNGAMIATLGAYKSTLGVGPVDPDTLEAQPNLVM